MSGDKSCSSSGIFAKCLRALIIAALWLSKSSLVLPVIIVPSASSIAEQGTPVFACFSTAYLYASLFSGVIFKVFIKIRIFSDSTASRLFLLSFSSALKYLLIISCLDASLHASSSEIAKPTIFIPISVGDLYGDSSIIFSNKVLSTGNTSISRL